MFERNMLHTIVENVELLFKLMILNTHTVNVRPKTCEIFCQKLMKNEIEYIPRAHFYISSENDVKGTSKNVPSRIEEYRRCDVQHGNTQLHNVHMEFNAVFSALAFADGNHVES